MARTVLILLLCIGLTLPKATATLAVLLPGSFSTIVICTGSEVAIISLDARGEPIKNTEIHGLECLSETAQAAAKQINPPWQIMHRQFGVRFSLREAALFGPSPEDRPSLGRAPPLQDVTSFQTSLA